MRHHIPIHKQLEKYDQNDMDYTEHAALRGTKMAVENGKDYYARPKDVSLSQTIYFHVR